MGSGKWQTWYLEGSKRGEEVWGLKWGLGKPGSPQASNQPLHLGAGSLKMGIWFVFIALVYTDSLLDLNTFMSE